MGDPCDVTIQIPPRCEGCTKNEAQVGMCRIRVYQFQVFGSQCPRELAFPEETTEEVASEVTQTEDEAAYLHPTYETLGALSPVLRAPSGEVIDGVHRLELDPSWFSLTLHDVNDPVKVAMAKLIINVVRRKVSAEEKSRLLSDIAKLTGWTPHQIADSMGLSYSWVMKYLPSQYKDKEMAEWGRKGAEARMADIDKRKATRRVASEEAEVTVASTQRKPKPEPLLTGFKGECPLCHATLLIEHREFPDGARDHKIIGEKPA